MDKFLLLLYPLLPPPQSIPDKSVPYCSLTEEEEHTHYVCSVLAISYLGAKHEFEIWAFKVFFLWTPKASLRVASRGSDLNIKIG